MPADIRKPLKKCLPHLSQAKADNLNEADTVQRIIKVFEDVLGYDGMTDLSREANMKGKFVDLVVKIDGTIRLLVEAKPAGETLRDRHIEQAQGYASRNNYRWVLLTNGTAWNLYHLTFDTGIEYERAFSVDLANADDLDRAIELLGYLHKKALEKGELDDFWQRTAALGPESIGGAIFKEGVIALIRRELRKDTGLLIDPEDLAKAIHTMLSPEARELIGPARVRRKRATPRKPTPGEPPGADPTIVVTVQDQSKPGGNSAPPVAA